jgi:tRNA(adenine34) deaminase
LEGCTLAVTVELHDARSPGVGPDLYPRSSVPWSRKTGGRITVDVVRDPRLNHRPEVYGGVLSLSALLLRSFFRRLSTLKTARWGDLGKYGASI